MNRWSELAAEISQTGYYPELVTDSLKLAIAAEPVSAFVLSYETIFDNEEVRRHVTVAALTATRLVVSHTDEQPADAGSGAQRECHADQRAIGIAHASSFRPC